VIQQKSGEGEILYSEGFRKRFTKSFSRDMFKAASCLGICSTHGCKRGKGTGGVSAQNMQGTANKFITLTKQQLKTDKTTWQGNYGHEGSRRAKQVAKCLTGGVSEPGCSDYAPC